MYYPVCLSFQLAVCVLVACVAADNVRQKRGILSGLHSPNGLSVGSSSGYSYSAPPSSYSAPSVSYSAPSFSYSEPAPSISYSAPAPALSLAPAIGYSSAPAVSYSAPSVSYSAPSSYSYSPAPAVSYSAPVASMPLQCRTRPQRPGSLPSRKLWMLRKWSPFLKWLMYKKWSPFPKWSRWTRWCPSVVAPAVCPVVAAPNTPAATVRVTPTAGNLCSMNSSQMLNIRFILILFF